MGTSLVPTWDGCFAGDAGGVAGDAGGVAGDVGLVCLFFNRLKVGTSLVPT